MRILSSTNLRLRKIAFTLLISSDEESVGGPVDVALISKGDGFIWIKRKHYFEKKYNPYFIKNYYK